MTTSKSFPEHHVAPDGRMTLVGHLHELRQRLIWSVLALLLASGLCFAYASELFAWLRQPLDGIASHQLIVLTPLEMFLTYIKIAVVGGIFLASPMILLQLWLFVAPGLYPHERRWVIPFVLFGSSCFIGGAAFCFYVVLPQSFVYLVDMVPMQVEAHYSVSAYFSLVTQLMLAFGLVFELPLIMALLAASGVITAKQFAQFRKPWIVAAVVLGGILTPTPDPLTQLLMAGPLIAFFELGILIAIMLQRRRGRPVQSSS